MEVIFKSSLRYITHQMILIDILESADFYLDRNLGFCSYVSSTLLKDIFIKKLFLNLLHAKFSRKIYLINISCTLFYLTILPTFMALFSELPQLNITAKMTLQSAEYSKSLQTF